ncbi:MAG: arginine--tRNA ligase [Myxococcales bacterium]|nr:arginine--tRNA ligase [Deltaproteobacteria bacterium]MBT8482308.1 arginine--tRNA ligase [Deltaproteobacteria bacterium]NNK09273.1 arginine--tRNA ligase [Myxococcales bacterium]NNK42909.1 arginine--tRNA ligase [Myxococcales bacterium]NNL25170.1 arginine--tRNA ligase [Myxococcales bacterium]
MLLERYLESLGAHAIAEALDLDAPRPALIRPTQDAKFGDFQINGAMPLAKELRKPPRELAQPIAAALTGIDAIERAEVAGPGFVNIHLSPAWVAERLTDALRDRDRDGVPAVEDVSKVIVDFSSPNIAKQMHVGHLRSTIIGDAIARILSFLGDDVVRDNHIGDWGTQFGLLIVGMREWGDEAALQTDPIKELERVYKLASKRAGGEEDFAQRARDELAKLQASDPENLELWKHFVQVSRGSLDAVYAELDVSFDLWLGESAYHEALPGIVEDLLGKGIAREDEGAVCIFWSETDDAPKSLRKQKTPFIVRKKDGAFLYSTTDIATVQHRKRQLHADRALYVVDNRQSLHFKQLFAVMRLLDVDMELEHIGFGTVLGKDGKPLRTRDASGGVITLASLLEEAKERARQRIEEGIAEGRLRVLPEEIGEVARVVGIGAVKYADLRQNRLSDYQFDWDKMISFQGNAGPYLQYAYARCASIFAKGGLEMDAIAESASIRLDAPAEQTLGKHLLRFGDVVYQAGATSQPHLICEHIYELARAFNGFYAECPVLDADEPTRASRLGLTALSARQIRRGLGLVGIGVVDRM